MGLRITRPSSVDTLRNRALKLLEETFGEDIQDHRDRGHTIESGYEPTERYAAAACECGDTFRAEV